MAKLQLDLSMDVSELELIGIRSTQKAHRLIWQLNKRFNWHMERMSDFERNYSSSSKDDLFADTEITDRYARYHFQKKSKNLKATLVDNVWQGRALRIDKRQPDYLLHLDTDQVDRADFLTTLHTLSGVDQAFLIETDENSPEAIPFHTFL